MPPKSDNPPSSDPNSYGFIFNNKTSNKGRRLPKLNVPRPVMIFGLVCIFFLVLILVLGLRSKSGNSSGLLDIAARQHEILRVSALADDDVKDQQVKNLIASVKAILASEQQETIGYLGVKEKSSSLNKYLDASTDAQLKAAVSNNTIDATYLTYLKQSLLAYQRVVQAESLVATTSAQPLLNSAKTDSEALLSSSLLSGASAN